MALIKRGADHWICADAGSRLAGVGLCAAVAVAAWGAVLYWGIRTGAGCGLTDASDVALVENVADDQVGSDAGAVLAGISLCAEVGVVAGCTVGYWWI
jgi:hypothetical protein